ncbi:hypothetical protein [Actinokineospora xionganensis]|uniref:Uncharacterized protein n=1 Tax=Actinokineospora xionganensis TaxID=2684470 RepID=A0ABR7L5V1_9PSEU|nr:hypothetical protein [Actinokineospora xionganensis]MBC6448067.1 hypothetical protein [Actinokineospora xionganensis]
MPDDRAAFAVELNALDEIANKFLPNAASALRAPVEIITAHEGLEGPGRLQAVYDMEGAYANFTDSIGHRQSRGCDRIDETAQALRDIIALYRRADGQG